MLLKRALSDEILRMLRVFPVVAITGSRQVGKTTLARMLLDEIAVPAVFLDLENYEDMAKLRNPAPF